LGGDAGVIQIELADYLDVLVAESVTKRDTQSEVFVSSSLSRWSAVSLRMADEPEQSMAEGLQLWPPETRHAPANAIPVAWGIIGCSSGR
jgi:hypothetical protein